MGWFGPRGLASIVFAIIALEERIPHRQMLFTTVMMTILLSVILHGMSSVPLVAAHSRHHPTPEQTEPATTQQRAPQ